MGKKGQGVQRDRLKCYIVLITDFSGSNHLDQEITRLFIGKS